MSSKITIIGAGSVGSTIAYTLSSQDIASEIVLIDINKKKAEGEVLDVPTRSFGGIGIFAIREMGRFYRHVLIEGNYPHHGAVMFGHYGKLFFEVVKFLGIDVNKIGYNQPAGVRYPTENPWG